MKWQFIVPTFLTPFLCAQANYSLVTNPAGANSNLSIMQIVHVTATNQTNQPVATQVDHYAAVAPTPITQSTRNTFAGGSSVTWKRTTNQHLNSGHDPSHWSVGSDVLCRLNNPNGLHLALSWSVSSRIVIFDPTSGAGTLRMEVAPDPQVTNPFSLNAWTARPRLEVKINGVTHTTAATFPQPIHTTTRAQKDLQFTEIRFQPSPLPQVIDVRFSGVLHSQQRTHNGLRRYLASVSFYPNASPMEKVSDPEQQLLLATFERTPLAGLTDEIVFRGDFDNSNASFSVAPDPKDFLAFWAIGQPMAWPLPALPGCLVEVDVFGIGYNGLETAIYRPAPLTDFVDTTLALPIDHGTWYLQWIVSNSRLEHTLTSSTFRIN
ncbi:MAG: hypothetical protein VYE77_11360 [Planctomycetota bacterium]|nr:hypothetical protein [Planctomycetota bacterium]